MTSIGFFQALEKEYFRKDGTSMPVLIGGATFKGRNGEGVAFVVDLSKQKRAEEALQKTQMGTGGARNNVGGANRIDRLRS